MSIQVHVQEDFYIDGAKVWVSTKLAGGGRLILHMKDGSYSWDSVEDGAISEPTFVLPMDTGRAVLDALLRHYQGASDMHTVRADLLHERGRVDKLIDHLMKH